MAFTVSERVQLKKAFTGFAFVQDAVALPQGGAVVVGTVSGSSRGLMSFYDVSGQLTRSLDLPFNGVPTALARLTDGSLAMTFAIGSEGYLARFTANGTLIGSPRATTGFNDLVALPGGDILTVGNSLLSVWSVFGTDLIPSTQSLLTTAATNGIAATLLDSGNVALVWSNLSGGSTRILTAVVAPDGTFLLTPAIRDASGTINRDPAIVATAEGFVTAYIDNQFGASEVVLAYQNASGASLGTMRVTISPGAEQTPQLARMGDKIVLSYTDNTNPDSDVVVRVFPQTLADYARGETVFPFASDMDEERSVTVQTGEGAFLTFIRNNSLAQSEALRGYVARQYLGDDANDSVVATRGAEIFALGGGANGVSYASSTAGVYVDLVEGQGAGGFAADDLFLGAIRTVTGSAFADRIIGDATANALRGRAGSDTLSGNAGNDTLTGGAGRDLLTGGVGSDVFVFATVADSAKGAARDVIRDFARGASGDDIDLSAIDANTRMAGNQTFAFSGTLAAKNAVWIKAIGPDLIVRADVNGDRVADLEIAVKGIASLTAGDFIL